LSSEQCLLPAEHIAGGGVEFASREGHGHVNVSGVLETMWTGRVAGGASRQDHAIAIAAGVVHGERRENVLLQKVTVRLAADLFQQVAEQGITGVAVVPFFARLEIERLIAEARYQLLGRDGTALQFLVIGKRGEAWDARSVGEQVDESDVFPGGRLV